MYKGKAPIPKNLRLLLRACKDIFCLSLKVLIVCFLDNKYHHFTSEFLASEMNKLVCIRFAYDWMYHAMLEIPCFLYVSFDVFEIHFETVEVVDFYSCELLL